MNKLRIAALLLVSISTIGTASASAQYMFSGQSCSTLYSQSSSSNGAYTTGYTNAGSGAVTAYCPISNMPGSGMSFTGASVVYTDLNSTASSSANFWSYLSVTNWDQTVYTSATLYGCSTTSGCSMPSSVSYTGHNDLTWSSNPLTTGSPPAVLYPLNVALVTAVPTSSSHIDRYTVSY